MGVIFEVTEELLDCFEGKLKLHLALKELVREATEPFVLDLERQILRICEAEDIQLREFSQKYQAKIMCEKRGGLVDGIVLKAQVCKRGEVETPDET